MGVYLKVQGEYLQGGAAGGQGTAYVNAGSAAAKTACQFVYVSCPLPSCRCFFK